ncbi:MAG TPA: arylsulfotransferase family protein [Solirubrobacteraceae bacterium]|nr:arylsulfotransferase family protein [Solirubrobacteraceae bacterium]
MDRRVDPRSDIFVAPKRNYGLHERMLGQSGPEILDGRGNPIWEHPLGRGRAATDFRVQSAYGQPVLTWWQGVLTSHGIGHDGEDVVFNTSYQPVASVHAVNGYHADVHEFFITPRNTAYIVAWRVVRRHLSRFGGPRRGRVIDTAVQELDLQTNRLLWQWDPLEHGLLSESRVPAPKTGTWNPFHVNSVDENAAGNLLISARNTWAVYYVNRRTGDIIWRLGGKHSTFSVERHARFAWQHDARFQPNHKISVFDNEAAPQEANRSRGLVLSLDVRHRRAKVAIQYTHPPPPLLAGSQGSTQLLPNGQVFVGWGQLPYFSEFSRSGRLLFDGHFHRPDESYRAARYIWTGSPTYPPSIAVRAAGSHLTTVYASWNGATRVARWQVLAGPTSAAAVTPVGSPVARIGFETPINAQNDGPWFAVQALDAYGNVLGTSPARERPHSG